MLEIYLNWLKAHQFFGIKPGLYRIISLLKKLGNPHQKYPVLHIAGTNGKGSTCAILQALLSEHGLKTGLYTSPHLFKLNERFRINFEDISDDELLEMLKILKRFSTEPVTYFELTTALAFLYFAEKKVDLAVIETGLGGRLDATNVVNPEASLITSIGLDHTKYLGNTLEKIAFEKAGIIKRSKPVILGKIEEKPLKVILERAQRLNCKVFSLNQDFFIYFKEDFWNYEGTYRFYELELALKGYYQGNNLALALKGLEVLEENGFLKIEENAVKRALKKVRWEGRYKKLRLKDKEILVDCAHNPEGIKTLKAELLREGFYPFLLVLGATNEDGEKPFHLFLEELYPLSQGLYLTEFEAERRVVTLEEWKGVLRDGMEARFYKHPKEALVKALKNKDTSRILITGSIYFVAEALKALKELEDALQ